MGDEIPPSTGAPSRAHEHTSANRRRPSCSCWGTRSSSRPSTRSSRRGEPARGARGARRPRRADGASPDGRPGPLHLHGPGRDHGVRDPARCDRRAAVSEFFEPPLSATVAFVLAFAILTYLSVVLGELVPEGGRACRRPRCSRSLSPSRSTGSRGSRTRSYGCCRSPPTSCSASCGSSPRRPG